MRLMKTTHKVPVVPLERYKRTKIIATVGPATNDYQSILGLIKAGANGIRLNFSHGTYEERREQIKWVRTASKKLGKPVAIVLDVQGPKIRLGDFEGEYQVRTGSRFTLEYGAEFDVHGGLLPTQFDLSQKVKAGERLLLADGAIQTEIKHVQ